MELRHAQIHDVPALKQLWKTCFGDEKAYIDLYFNDLFRPRELVLLEEEGEICSMAALIPAKLRAPAVTLPVFYLYAMCTRPELRGKGYGRKLLDFAADYARSWGAAAITLVPANQGLFSFYGKAGYRTAFWNRTVVSGREGLPPATGMILPVTPRKYGEIRRAALGAQPYLDYTEEFLEHQLQVCALAEGGLLRLDLPCGTGCAAVEKGENGKRYLKELVTPPGGERQALALLLTSPRANVLEARIPAREGEPGTCPFGMILWLTGARAELKNAYLGLALD